MHSLYKEALLQAGCRCEILADELATKVAIGELTINEAKMRIL